MKRQMIQLAVIAVLAGVGMAAWSMTSRAGYESAKYVVLEANGSIEIREYPDLVLAATDSRMDSQGSDGSFMRLFGYISGANEDNRKIAMTTPVFMQREVGRSDVSMGFVLPQAVAAEGVPKPQGAGVKIRRRHGGLFSVIRFSGQLDSQTAKEQESKLREWMKSRGLKGVPEVEAAGYDPPFTPGPLRRNEVLIRLDDAAKPENASRELGSSPGLELR